MSLKSSIRETERSITDRRRQLGDAVDGVTRAVSTRMVSPSALVTAGLVGAALHQNNERHVLRMLALLEATNAGLRRLISLSSRTPPPATPR